MGRELWHDAVPPARLEGRPPWPWAGDELGRHVKGLEELGLGRKLRLHSRTGDGVLENPAVSTTTLIVRRTTYTAS